MAYGPSENVPAALDETFAKFKAEGELKGFDPANFAARLAYYYGELDAIHAFREGNSRTLRAFTSDLATSAGHRLDWSRNGTADEDRQRLYHARDVALMRGDTAELADIIASCLHRD